MGQGPQGEHAQGEFSIVTMRVKNIGSKPHGFDSGNQVLFDRRGRQYHVATGAERALPPSKRFPARINPGHSVTGELVFDVPKSFRSDHIELHSSGYSSGVSVELR